jgi:phosphoglycolate phosphatase
MPHLHGLIFDLDGTLIDSAADLRVALNALLAQYGRRSITLAEVKQMVGDGLQVMLQRAFTSTGAPLPDSGRSTIFEDFIDLYQRQTGTPEMLYPLALETIKTYRAKGVKIGLCTNKISIATRKLLKDIGIEPLFDCVAGGDTFPVCKPHPAHVLGVAKAMNVAPQSCVMIGDSHNDIRAAQGVPMVAIAVGHGYGRDIATLGADAMIADFAGLPEALQRLGFTTP